MNKIENKNYKDPDYSNDHNFNPKKSPVNIPDIKYWRRTEFNDFNKLYELIRMETFHTFGDVDPAVISEKSSISIVQINSIDQIVGNISLCNYPNIPSVPCSGWIEWISKHYGIHGITERNTFFIHMILWDHRYDDLFYKQILDAVFLSSIHTTHVILVLPPWVAPATFVEKYMTRIVPNGENDSHRIQALYISLRHMHCPRLKIRRVVEEDNDDIVPILDKESEKMQQIYGEFYISEMMRYPDGIRQIIVAESYSDGIATGVLCLNEIADVQSLNIYFELDAYNGLRKYQLDIKTKIMDRENMKNVNYSDILFPVEEIEGNDNFKVKPSFGTPEFHSKEDIHGEDFYYQNKDDIEECSCYDDGEICNNIDHSIMKNSIDFGTETDDSFQEMKTHSSSSNFVDQTKLSDTTSDADIKNDYESSTVKEISKNSQSGIKNVLIIEPRKFRSSFYQGGNNFSEEDKEISRREDVPVEINHKKIIHKDINLANYFGDLNAFTLELFSMRDDIDERLSNDYLEAVFECFPDKDYCLVLIPPLFPTFPLLQSFVRVPLRFNKDYPLAMYLAHRASITGDLKIRESILSDIYGIEEILADLLPERNKIFDYFQSAVNNNRSSYFAHTFLCDEKIVGFSILCVESDIELIRNRYRIDDFISFDNFPIDSHARIIYLTIMPIFANHHRYFFQQLMNLGNLQALYYRLYHRDASAMTRTEPLVTFLAEMIPVVQRKNVEYFLKNNSKNGEVDSSSKNVRKNNFALYMMVPRIASSQKIDVNVRIVVVGASDCGLALLESLVLGRNSSSINLTNVTLISPRGIPFENSLDDCENNYLPYSGRYSSDYRHLVGTRAWINVVHGTLNTINRKDKFVTVSTMGSIYYDYLILTCGLQYQRLKFAEELRAERKGFFGDYPNPENCLTINTERDAANCLKYFENVLGKNSSCSVIFYGQNIECYSAMEMFIRYGLPPENITVVEPPVNMCENLDKTFSGNDEIERAVINSCKLSGVKFIYNHEIVDWILDKYNEDYFIRNLIIERKGNRKKLDCDVLINFNEKTINMDTFFAICKSGLVFDGSLVIDPEFSTNDPLIFSAGTITKYSRRYYADDFSHKYQNSIEVGERLGQKLRNIIDPKNSSKNISKKLKSTSDMNLPCFKKAIITSCRLPGGYFYLDVKKPGKLISENINDVILITGSPESDVGYFRIKFNEFDTVETITCLSKKEFEIENYISLYGKHEALLNDIKIRFQNSTISDLFAYFREPWAVALFFDEFQCLRIENRATLLSPTIVCGDNLVHDCVKALIKSKWKPKMLKSVSPRLSPRGNTEPRIIRLTTDQEAVLQEQFTRCPRAPHTADIVLLAAETGLSEADVQGWYGIRLAQWRKEQGLGGNIHFSN